MPSLMRPRRTRRSQASASSRPPPIVWPGQHRERRVGERLERVDRLGERVGDQRARRAPRTPRRGSRRCRSPPRTSRARPSRSRSGARSGGAQLGERVAVIASRIGWSSALRLAGFEIVRRDDAGGGLVDQELAVGELAWEGAALDTAPTGYRRASPARLVARGPSRPPAGRPARLPSRAAAAYEQQAARRAVQPDRDLSAIAGCDREEPDPPAAHAPRVSAAAVARDRCGCGG